MGHKNKSGSRKRLKDSIELVSTYKGRKLTLDEVKTIRYLGEPIERTENSNKATRDNPQKDITSLKDSIKY